MSTISSYSSIFEKVSAPYLKSPCELGKNILLEPRLIALERGDDGSVRLGELLLELFVLRLFKGRGNVRLEKS